MARISLWWQAVRPFAFTVSVIPPILGGLIALLENPGLEFHTFHFILTLTGCMIAHAGANLLSDYFDHKLRVDREGTFGSSGLLVQKMMRPGEILRGALIAFIAAGLIAVYLVLAIPNGLFLLGLVLIGALFGIFYTAGPFSWKYHALGDIAVFVSFGSAMVLGAYYVQAHHFSWSPVLYALPIAFLVDAILHSNNLRDIENDRAVQIKTLAIVIGENWSKTMYIGLLFAAYISIPLLIAWARLPLISLVTFLTLPLAFKLVKMVRKKKKMPVDEFAVIDMATAQFHSAFGVLMILAIIVQYFFIS